MILVRSHEADGFDFGRHLRIHAGHLEFVIEIRHRPQPSNNEPGADGMGKRNQQPLDSHDLNASRNILVKMADFIPHQFNTLLEREYRSFFRIDCYGYDQLVEQGGPLDMMSVCP